MDSRLLVYPHHGAKFNIFKKFFILRLDFLFIKQKKRLFQSFFYHPPGKLFEASPASFSC